MFVIKMKKSLGIFLITIFCITFAVAGVFILSAFNFSFSFTVEEPLSIEYHWNDSTIDCKTATGYKTFSGTIDAGRTIYPGNKEVICFKIHSLSNGNIPLFVNYTGGDEIEDYSIELSFFGGVRPGDNYLSLNLTIAPDADGVSTGSIIFGRGN